MAKYQSSTGEIVDAVQFKPLPEGTAWPKGVTSWDGQPGGQPRDMSWGFVDTPEGRCHVLADDWILTDAAGGQHVFRPIAFEAEYKPVRTTTERGFAIYDQFKDQKGSEIQIQRSSLATEACVWIFSGNIDAHLTVEQAKKVRDALDAFITEAS